MVGKGYIAELAHVELLTPQLRESATFFRDILGMETSAVTEHSVYLRGYADPYHHSLKLTSAPHPGLGHVAWRVSSPEALNHLARVLQGTPYADGWHDGDIGHGAAFRFRTPEGHTMELLWEVEKEHLTTKSRLPLRLQPRPLRGIPVARLDHVHLYAKDVQVNREFFVSELGFRFTVRFIDGEGEMAAFLSVTPVVHDLGISRERSGGTARLNHVAFRYGSIIELLTAADSLKELGVEIHGGPGLHPVSLAWFVYILEPGGNRVELFSDPGLLITDPTWETVTVQATGGQQGGVWVGAPVIPSFFDYGTPPPES